jgi:hypothetical protein
MHAMRLYLINPSNPLVGIVNVKESRWNRYRVWKPLSLMVLAGVTPAGLSRIGLNPATDDRVKTSQCSLSFRTRSAIATQGNSR